MKLSKLDMIILALGALITWMPNLPILEQIFAHPAGRLAAISTLLYAQSKLGTNVALLLVLLYVRYAKGNTTWEHMSIGHSGQCSCKPGQTYDDATKMCKTAEGTLSPPTECTCPAGFEWKDGECHERPAIEPISAEMMYAAAVSPTSGPKSTAPMTTPAEAQRMASQAPRETMTAGPVPNDRSVPQMASV